MRSHAGHLIKRTSIACAVALTLLTSATLSAAGQELQATPALSMPILSMAVERSAHADYIDIDPPGLSPGDRYIWGPNPLYDGENVIDTGVSVAGECAVFNAAGDCWAVETITFGLDGSTLRVHGIMPADGGPARLTIFAGTGAFQSTTGTVTITSIPDGRTWHRQFELEI